MSHAYVGREAVHVGSYDASLSVIARSVPSDFNRVSELEWNGLFALALARMCRYVESKAMAKVLAVAREIVASGDGAADPAPAQGAVARELRSAGEAALARYVLVCGQRLAHFFRNSFVAGWGGAPALAAEAPRPPTGPRLVVEMV